jgi:dienelactone hydrolase
MRLSGTIVFGLWVTVSAQNLQVTPKRVMADESAAIVVTGLQPNEHAAIQAELTDGVGHVWKAQAEFISDEQGVIDASKQAPVSGSYKELSAMGLIWSMLPAEKRVALYQPPRNFAPQTIEFRLMRKGEAVSTAQLEQVFLAEGEQRLALKEGDLRGVLFLPASKERRPGVLVLSGSNGGAPVRQAAWLASHGFAAMALAYFRYDDLPDKLEAIPLEYFGKALVWMSNRPEIQPDRLAVMGTSRGGELALQLGSMFKAITAVVAYVPANVRFPACCGDNRVPYAWTWTGKPLAWVPPRMMRNLEVARDGAIAVENTHGPILLISGEDDHVWDSSGMANAVIGRLKLNHFPHEFEHLRYPHAGHGAGKPDITPAWHGEVRQPVSGRAMDLGGSARGDALSSLDAMPKVIEFLQRSLQQH